MKINQEPMVYGVIQSFGGRARTEQIKIRSMYKHISCADRYLRWMSERGIITNIGKAKKGDKTDMWVIKQKYTTKEQWIASHKTELF